MWKIRVASRIVVGPRPWLLVLACVAVVVVEEEEVEEKKEEEEKMVEEEEEVEADEPAGKSMRGEKLLQRSASVWGGRKSGEDPVVSREHTLASPPTSLAVIAMSSSNWLAGPPKSPEG